jgi:hypothetical protein
MQALARLRNGDPDGAYDSASRALSFIVAAQPVGYWMQQSTAAVAEVLLTLLEADRGPAPCTVLRDQARQAVRALRRFARRFPMGRAQTLLWSALLAWLGGHHRAAMRGWRRTTETAAHLGAPYEQARAHFEIGRHLPFDALPRRAHLERAVMLFEGLGCATDGARARAEHERRRPA